MHKMSCDSAAIVRHNIGDALTMHKVCCNSAVTVYQYIGNAVTRQWQWQWQGCNDVATMPQHVGDALTVHPHRSHVFGPCGCARHVALQHCDDNVVITH